jgi:hypothetical protein
MKNFLDTGFLLTLLFKTSGSEAAWEIARGLGTPLEVSTLQLFSTENRILRQVEAPESTPSQRAMAANALQNLRWYVEQHVLVPVAIDYEIAIHLAQQWQRHASQVLPALLLLWPALAATAGATAFLSFDPRTRQMARHAGLKILPEKL